MVIDYCSNKFSLSSFNKNQNLSFISLQSNYSAMLNELPIKANNENNLNITKLSEARNLLAFYSDKIKKLKKSNYDVIIINPFYDDTNQTIDPKPYQIKMNGSRRLIVGYAPIAEVIPEMYFYKQAQLFANPNHINHEFGSLIVNYWLKGWQNLLNEYIAKLVYAGYDGVFLDVVDTFCFFTKDC